MTSGYDPTAYGRIWAPVFDTMLASSDPAATDAAADAIAKLAGGGRVLEFGIGTGRLALPIAARGVDVVGLDASPEMVEQLRGKPGGDLIPVTIGDMTGERVDGEFDVVLIAFNTIFALPEQHLQVECLHNATRHLTPVGAVVIEAFVPTLERTPLHHVAGARYRAPDHVSFTIVDNDPVKAVGLPGRLESSEGARWRGWWAAGSPVALVPRQPTLPCPRPAAYCCLREKRTCATDGELANSTHS